jgi:hypothetical protein
MNNSGEKGCGLIPPASVGMNMVIEMTSPVDARASPVR